MNVKNSTANPYINIGGTQIVLKEEVLGIFDLDASSTKTDTKRFLSKCESEGHLITVGNDIPKSFVVCDHPYHRQLVYISQLTPQTLQKRSQGENG